MQKKLQQITDYLRQKVQIEHFVALDTLFDELKVLLAASPEAAAAVENYFIHFLQTTPVHDLYFLYLSSALLKLFPRARYIDLLANAALNSRLLSVQNREFLCYQLNAHLFRYPEIKKYINTALLDQLYQCVLTALRAATHLTPVPKEARNPNRVVVMTPNFLSERHAPTHSTLERSYLLKTLGGLDVHIISTTKGTSTTGRLPLYQGYSIANKVDAYTGSHDYVWHGEHFPLCQPEGSINTPAVLQQLLDYVTALAPYYILYVGGRSYVADLLNDYCPVVTVSTVFSTIPSCNTAFAMVGRKVTEEERALHTAKIIEVPFSFELSEKKRTHTRAELHIPEDAFVMAVVGNRLDSDLTDEFYDLLESVEHGFLLLLGDYPGYEQLFSKHSWLAERSAFLGYVDDVIGILECADLFVNPHRLGGGFSVIEAFHAGIPAVSFSYGDVAVAAGAEFCVADSAELLATIRRYQNDPEFYQSQLALARKREAEITNGAPFYEEGIKKLLDSEHFY
ncbi:MAG: glycosyltransferase [Lachnospiraceae bacterium]|nr:glycosyltransferase [Lachnospiraceae bacterium]